jgi:hypothetical protein
VSWIDIEHDQAQRHLQRRGKGHAALAALVDVVLRRFEVVATNSSIDDAGKSEIGNTDLKTDCRPSSWAPALGLVDLQELVVGRLLNLDEVRHLRDFRMCRRTCGHACGR